MEGKYPDPIKYYEFLYNKVTFKILPKFTDQMVKEEFTCVLAKNMKYEQVPPTRTPSIPSSSYFGRD